MMRFVIRQLWLLVIASVSSTMTRNASAEVLYNVDFEAPTHTVDQVVVAHLGAIPRNAPSSINFGQPTIRTEAGVLDGQFCRFDQAHTTADTLHYCQLGFGLDSSAAIATQYPSYRFQFDTVVHGLQDSDVLTVFIDDSNIQPITFRSDQQIWAGGTGKIGTYLYDSRMGFQVDVDNAHRSWVISMNGSRLVSAPLITLAGNSHDMVSLRFSLSAAGVSSSVDIDNVRIEGLPEPTTCGLFFTTLLLLGRPQRRCSRCRVTLTH